MQFQKIFLLIAGALGLACQPVCASSAGAAQQTRPIPRSVTQPLSPARIKSTLADYQRWLDRLAERHAVAGLVTAVVINDKVVYERTVGYADAATQQPMTPDTVFRLASLSKA
ncbi:MAG TPA: serine hydrolase domain-containing protein, partial [Rhodanobacter sp.]